MRTLTEFLSWYSPDNRSQILGVSRDDCCNPDSPAHFEVVHSAEQRVRRRARVRVCRRRNTTHVLWRQRDTSSPQTALRPMTSCRPRCCLATLGRWCCDSTYYWRYIPLVSTFLWGPGAFLPRPEDRRQPPFLDQLYASNGGCSTTMCHRLGAGALQRGRGGEAGWPAAPPGRLVARAAPATSRARHAKPRSWLAALRSILARNAPHNVLKAVRGSAVASRRPRHCGTPDGRAASRTAHYSRPAQLYRRILTTPSARSAARSFIAVDGRLTLTSITMIMWERLDIYFGYVWYGDRRWRSVVFHGSLRNA